MDCIYAEGYVQDLLSHLKIIFHNRKMQDELNQIIGQAT
jgi:hypothetical protein